MSYAISISISHKIPRNSSWLLIPHFMKSNENFSWCDGVCVYMEGVEWKFPFPFILENFSVLNFPSSHLTRDSLARQRKKRKKTAESQTVKLWKICQSWLYDCVTRLFSFPGGGGRELERGGGGQEANRKKMLRNFLSCVNGPRTRQKCAISTPPKRNVSIACVELPSKSSQKLENAHNCGRSFKAFSSSMEKKYQLKIAIVLLLSVMKEWGRNCFMFFAAFISHSCTQHNFFYACMSTREKSLLLLFFFFGNSNLMLSRFSKCSNAH